MIIILNFYLIIRFPFEIEQNTTWIDLFKSIAL